MLYSLDKRVPEIADGVWIADTARVIGSVRLLAGSSVWYGCTLRGDMDQITVGENSNVQDGAVLHTDAGVKLSIGRDCTVGHQAMLHGCSIGDNSLIGIQSVILNRAVIGKNTVVGACSFVAEGKSFPDGVLLLGSPAKVVRELLPQEIQMITLSAQHYVRNAKRFKESLRVVQGNGD
jgi:carbonic anhydrase/acetyltransferase-like protein (isoleucine patch superfamily)